MKIVCTQENLKNGIQLVSRFTASSLSIPALSSVLLETENGMLKISGTNLELGIISFIRCKVEVEGSVCIPVRTITDLVMNLPAVPITLTADSGSLHIDGGEIKTNIKTIPVEEFPALPELSLGQTIQIPGEEFKTALQNILFSVSSNQTQLELSGVLLQQRTGQVTLVGTDRYRLAEYTISSPEFFGEVDLLIPFKTAQEVVRLITATVETVKIEYNENQITFTLGDTKITSRLIEAQFPDYKAIIPQQFETTLTTQISDLETTIRAAGVFAKSNGSIQLVYGAEKVLEVKTEPSEVGTFEAQVGAIITGSSGEVTLNYKFLLDVLRVLSTSEVEIYLNQNKTAVVVKPKLSTSYTYLIMPITKV